MKTRILLMVHISIFCFVSSGFAQENYQLELEMQNETNSDVAFAIFTENGENGHDVFDAFKLANLAGSYAELFTQDSDQNNLSINNLPLDLNEIIELPVYIRSTYADTFSVSVKKYQDFPENWTLSLIDTSRTDTLILNDSSSVNVIHEGTFESGVLTVMHFSLVVNPGIETQTISLSGTSGKNGWRFLGSPFSNVSYGVLLDSVWTQGASNSDAPGGSSNIFTWNESSQQFEAVTNLDSTPGQGTGFTAYLFEDDDGTTTEIEQGWPKSFQVTGISGFGDISIPVSYTEGIDSSLNGFNLVSNPYPFSIDWDAASGWTKTNIQDALWIWNPNDNGGDGGYLVYSEGAGDPISVIAPFQAFWVRADATTPVLNVTRDVKASGSGTLLKTKSPISQFAVSVSLDQWKDRHYLAFREQSSSRIDNRNTAKLSSLSDNFISIFSKADDQRLSIRSISANSERFEIPLFVESTMAGPASISLEGLGKLHNRYSFRLLDHENQRTTVLDESTEYTFDKGLQPRALTLFITSIELVETEPISSLPSAISLLQNYPNPFNPSTVIQYYLPKRDNIELAVFDMQGKQVANLVTGPTEAGHHEVTFNATNLASGLYLYRLTTSTITITKKLVLIK